MEIRNCKTLVYESMNYTVIIYAYEGDKEHYFPQLMYPYITTVLSWSIYCKYTAWLELILPRQGLAAAD